MTIPTGQLVARCSMGSYLTLALIACTTTSADRPNARTLRASDHLKAAHEHDEQARVAVFPDRRHDGTGRIDSMPSGPNAWSRRWDSSVDHERLARIHRSAVALIEAEYHEACGDRPLAQVSVSPLKRYGLGGTPTVDGVVIYLSPEAGPPDHLMAELRCHRAWMMLGPTGRNGMDECPLDLDGLKVAAAGDREEIVLTITVSDRALIEELQRRTGVELETTARPR